MIEVGLGFQFSEMDSSCGLECSTAYECPCMLRCLYDNMCLHQCVCVCVYACTRPHLHHFRVFTPQTTDTTGGQIHQKGARRMQGGSWSQANWNSPVCFVRVRGWLRDWALGPHPVHLTSVTFGCSTKDSGLILGMSMWIWQQHGRECVRHTRTHTHKHKHTQYKRPPHVLHFQTFSGVIKKWQRT